LQHGIDDRRDRESAIAAVRAVLRDLPGATLTGLSVIAHDIESLVRRELPRVLAIAVAAVTLYLLIHFRNLRSTLISITPMLVSLTVLLACMRMSGQKLNLVNLVALPLLIGIDVDYGIFLVSMFQKRNDVRRLEPTCHAVLMCGLTTLLGFGSLVTCSVPAVASLGIVSGVGIFGAMLGIFALALPLLLGIKVRRTA
jgi:predicted RND superfamily exporter protein